MGGFLMSPSSPAGKWIGFVTAVWVQAIAGNNYTFSNYSDALKSLMALTQLQLNNLSVAKDVGKAFGLLAGLASDRISTPVLLLIGSIEGIIGYGVQWLIVSQRIQPLPYWQMCIFLCMGGNSTTWMNTAILVTCIRNFRKNRGPVTGILKGYLGLSSAIFTDICTALFNNDPALFLLMLTVVPFIEVVEKRPPVIGEEHTVVEALKTVDFWILFVSFLCGVGTGLAVQNNMAQMGLAVGYADVSIFISLTSICGFFGRIGSGSISEYFMKKAGTPRPVWNAASQILMAVGYILMAIAMPGSLYIGAIVVGICYGVRLAITVPTTSEMFGLKYYGLMYNIIILNLPLGSFLFSGLLAGYLYDAEATPTAGGGNTCIGAHCYRLVFTVMAIVCVVGFVLDVWLAIRTKALYSKIYTNRKSKKSMAVSNGH
ncbi:putative MFS transporter superfamily [Helianthus debilis subsp. tardiflorus]